jgi:hydroxymethylpyrimidine pyrophosphatase-like HAD family hydrolase
MTEHLILDLDGTLLFAQEKPGAIAIQGRRRNSYLAIETIQILRELQESYDIILATGRSLLSIQIICKMMETNGVKLSGVVAENGGLIQQDDQVEYLVSHSWRQQVQALAQQLGDMAQVEFSTCLALIRPTHAEIEQARDFFQAMNGRAKLLKDGNKVFFLEENIDKRNALAHLLGETQLAMATGVGNDSNDIEWLKAVKNPAAPACAGEKVLETVTARKGFISQSTGHTGIAELLTGFKKGS